MQPSRYTFAFKSSGRSGTITCSNGQGFIELDCEMSGVRNLDMLLAPLDLRAWSTGQLLSREDQFILLSALREWLSSQKIRSDIDASSVVTTSTERCIWTECSNLAIDRLAYCATHRDISLLS
jgi:hypothetical protein